MKAPGFTAVVTVTLALVIGACTVVYSALNQIVLHPFDYPEPERVVALRDAHSAEVQTSSGSIGVVDFVDWRREAKSFEAMGVLTSRSVTYTGGSEPLSLWSLLITADIPRVWRDTPALGRWLLPEEFEPGKDKVVVLAYGFWQRALGGAANVVGRAILLDGEPWTVVGVASEKWSRTNGFYSLVRPMAFGDTDRANQVAANGRSYRKVEGQARLKPGVTIAQAQAEMDVIAAQLARQYSETNTGHGVRVLPLADYLGSNLRGVLFTLFAAIGCVLFIGCANIANLMLARATGRQREISLRAAVGASRARLVRQLLTESIVLALVGGLAGVLIARWGLGAVQAIAPRLQSVQLDSGMLAFSLGLSVATGLVFGLAPAWLASRVDLNEALKQGTRGSTEGGLRRRLRLALVALQVACAVVLLAGAGLFVRSFATLTQVSPGFELEHVTAMRLDPSPTKYGTNEQRVALMDALLERVRAIPGVQVAGGGSRAPFQGAHGMYDFAIDGRPPLLRSQSPTTIIYSVTPEFFRAANIPLLRGRMFTAYDNNAKAPPVALINETLAKQQFPNEDPIGKRISVGVGNDARPWREIVGVVADFKEDGLNLETRCQYYAPYAQYPFGFTILVRHQGNPAAVHAALKEQVYALDRDEPIAYIQKLAAFVNDSLWRERLTMQLLVAFSVLALVIAAVGIYGVIAYTVSQRTAEIGIRMALGATQTDVLGHVLREGMTVVAIGLALGVAATLGMGQLVQALLFKTSAHDPVVLAGIMVVIAAVALVACLVPARRAVKVDPVVALRAE